MFEKIVKLNTTKIETTNYFGVIWTHLQHEHAKYPFKTLNLNGLHHHHHLIIIFFHTHQILDCCYLLLEEFSFSRCNNNALTRHPLMGHQKGK